MGRRRRTSKMINSPVKGRRVNRVADSSSVSSETTSNGDEEQINQDCENDSIDLHRYPLLLNHKNFGKYRCLSNKILGEKWSDSNKTYNSDGEIVNNVEVKVVDPCASSESDSNSIDATNSPNRSLKFFSRFNKYDRNITSSSPTLLKSTLNVINDTDCSSSLKLQTDNQISLPLMRFDTQIPDPTLNIMSCHDPRRNMSSLNNFSSVLNGITPFIDTLSIAKNNEFGNYISNTASDDNCKNMANVQSNNDEIFTVFEIICDDSQNPECSAKDISTSLVETEENTHNMNGCQNDFSANDQVDYNKDVKDFETKLGDISSNDDSRLTFEIQCNDNSNSCDVKMETKEIFSNDNSSSCDRMENKEIRSNENSNSSDMKMENKEIHTTDNSNSCDTNLETNEKSVSKSSIDLEPHMTSSSNISEEEIQLSNNTDSEVTNTEKNEVSDSSSSSSTPRRSSRLKNISVLKQRCKGHGLVKNFQLKSLSPLVKKCMEKNSEHCSNKMQESLSLSQLNMSSQDSAIFPIPNMDCDIKPVKVKSRWRRSSEMEMGSKSPITPPLNSPNFNNSRLSSIAESSTPTNSSDTEQNDESHYYDKDIQDRLDQFQTILENEYHCERFASKEARKMTCDCFLTKEEIERGELGCGEDCLNRLLMIECNSRCPVGDRCTNRRFQTNQYSKLRVIKTEKKGLGIQAINDISRGEFLMEYVGEVLNWEQFSQRAQEYSSDKNMHHYFMSFKSDAVIDATLKGNISRFINHSCDPNAETQKWTVNGDLRIGFFSKRDIRAGDEITFDYQFQRYGKEGLRCFCEANNCRGWIGEEPDSEEEEEEEEDDEESEEESKSNDESNPEVASNAENLEIKDDITMFDVNDEIQEKPVQKILRRVRTKKSSPQKLNDLHKDLDLEKDMKHLRRTGIRNQCHTLSLCRAMVRAKHVEEKISLLKLLGSADLPCRRLFLDYRGLKLLAPWCETTDLCTRLEILTVLVKLPIPNKTILKETNIITNIEKWVSDAKSDKLKEYYYELFESCLHMKEFQNLLSESPDELNNQSETVKINDEEENVEQKRKLYFDIHIKNICSLSKELLDSWVVLQEAFKIPKKERIQLMKEHERQANELQNNEEIENEMKSEDRNKRFEKEKKHPVLSVLDIPRKNPIRLDDRILTPVPQMSKEERRREFAARAAHQDRMRRAQLSVNTKQPYSKEVPKLTRDHSSLQIKTNFENLAQNINTSNYNNAANGVALNSFSTPEQEYMQVDYVQNEYLQHSSQQYPASYFSQQNMYSAPSIDTSFPPPSAPSYGFSSNYTPSPYSNTSNYTPTQPVPPASPYNNNPISPNISNVQQIPQHYNQSNILPHQFPTLPSQSHPAGQPIPTLVTIQPTVDLSEPADVNEPQPIPSLVTSGNSNQHTAGSFKNEPEYFHPELPPTESKTLNIIEKADTVKCPTVRLPPRWRSIKDARGRTYYYHVKTRIPQWIPPLYSPTLKDDDSSDEQKLSDEEVQKEETIEERPIIREKLVEGVNGIFQIIKQDNTPKNGITKETKNVTHTVKKRRLALVTERIISPRKEEDIIASKLELKRYKQTKEKLRRRKVMALAAAGQTEELNKYKKELKIGKHKKEKEKVPEVNEKTAKRIKDIFTAQMARVMVHHLDPFRRDDCPIGRITSTEDFKHLAKKLTHFVMLKELKHCQTVNELECNDSVKQKAKEFVKKYMAKFGPIYQRSPEEKKF